MVRRETVDDYGVIYNGPSAATLILAGLLVCLLVGWGAWQFSQQPPPPPPAPAPEPPPSPQKAPPPPPGVSAKVERWLATLKNQARTVTTQPYQSHRAFDDAFDAIFDPAAEHVLDMVRDYEARVQDYAERCRKMIEK
jgi:hypothetical protein